MNLFSLLISRKNNEIVNMALSLQSINLSKNFIEGGLMRKTIFVAISLILMVSFAEAAIILPPGATWEYTFTNPTGDLNWSNTIGGWQTGLAPFGNNYADNYNSDFHPQTDWPADNTGNMNDDLWVRTALNLAGYDLSTIAWNLGVDNGFKLYINGNLLSSDMAEGYTSRWEYAGSILQSYLNNGNNVIALALEDHGSLTAFDMQITGNQSSVPEPSTLLLLGSGLAGVGLMRRKLRK